MKKAKVFILFVFSLLLVFTAIAGCSPNSNSDNQNEGIEVHGHWTIEVRNPDGSLVDSHEFENALENSGKERLAEFLAREYSVGGWMIRTGNTAVANNPFYDPEDSGAFELGQIFEEGAGVDPEPWRFFDLTVSTNNGLTLTLNGTAIAQRDGSISFVETLVNRIAATLPPASDYSMGAFPFTKKILAAPIAVSTGQYIVFTVVISFS